MNRLMFTMVISTICASFVGGILSDPIGTNLKLVVTTDGKSFFAESETTRNWSTAGAYCSSLGMKLAAITSRVQTDALRSAHNAEFSGDFWTAGRDSHELRQFSWNGTNQNLNPIYNDLHPTYVGPILTCLAFQSLEGNRSTLVYYACADPKGTLCET